MRKVEIDGGVLRLDIVDGIGLIILDWGNEIVVDFASRDLEKAERIFQELRDFFAT